MPLMKEWSMELEAAALELAATCAVNSRWDKEIPEFPSLGYSRAFTSPSKFFFREQPQNL